jgi:hypothetical protein
MFFVSPYPHWKITHFLSVRLRFVVPPKPWSAGQVWGSSCSSPGQADFSSYPKASEGLYIKYHKILMININSGNLIPYLWEDLTWKILIRTYQQYQQMKDRVLKVKTSTMVSWVFPHQPWLLHLGPSMEGVVPQHLDLLDLSLQNSDDCIVFDKHVCIIYIYYMYNHIYYESIQLLGYDAKQNIALNVNICPH